MRKSVKIILAIAGIIAAGVILINLPPIRERIQPRVDSIRYEIKNLISPPEKAVFIPKEQNDQVAAVVQATMQALSTLNADPTPTQMTASTQSSSEPTPTPTPAPTPLARAFNLGGITYQSQRYAWNYCAPANLAMALSFWGWKGDREDTAAILKPYSKDKNVMPYEMQDFVASQTELKSIVRVGGDLQMIKTFIANGFPVVIEKGEVLHGEYGEGSVGWMGHYMTFNGYDDDTKMLNSQDSLAGPDTPYPFDSLEGEWRAFNGVYLVIYPADKESLVMSILGPQADEKANYEYAATKASNEVYGLFGRDQFFAWFNRGTNLVGLQDYSGAAAAYDEAFKVYPTIPEQDRPYRMMWYQTGPYYAYYFTQRYYDVTQLATTTLDSMSEPSLEESYYWRARAYYALQDPNKAIPDLKLALKYHKGFAPAVQLLAELGVNS